MRTHTDEQQLFEGLDPVWRKAFAKATLQVIRADFAKMVTVYKYGGIAVDLDVSPVVNPQLWQGIRDCDTIFGLELACMLRSRNCAWPLARSFQLCFWAFAGRANSTFLRRLIEAAAANILGQRLLSHLPNESVQDVAGSGLLTDYVSLEFERHGMSYFDTMQRGQTVHLRGENGAPGLCILPLQFFSRGGYVNHAFEGSWKPGHR